MKAYKNISVSLDKGCLAKLGNIIKFFKQSENLRLTKSSIVRKIIEDYKIPEQEKEAGTCDY